MNNIYRREPIQHKLPTDFEDLDNIKFQSINNINGLQVYDNPLVADQNSTHDCKNVYRDELGNLTIRPAIWYDVSNTANEYLKENNNVRWYKKTSFGLFVIEQDDGYDKIIFTDENIELRILKDSNIVCNETEDGIYFLIQEHEKGTLQLHRFFKSEDNYAVEQVTGEIQLNDNINPNLSLYNILNDKMYSPQSVINSDDKLNNYNTTAEIIVGDIIPKESIVKILKYSDGLAILYHINNTLYLTMLKESGLIATINILKCSSFTACLQDYPDGKYFDITVTAFADSKIYVYNFNVAYDGTLSKIFAINLSDIDEYDEIASGVTGDLYDAYALYNGYWVLATYTPMSDKSYEYFAIALYLYKDKSKIAQISDSLSYFYVYNNDRLNLGNFKIIPAKDSFAILVTHQIPPVSLSDTDKLSILSCRYTASVNIASLTYSTPDKQLWNMNNVVLLECGAYSVLQVPYSESASSEEKYSDVYLLIDKSSTSQIYYIFEKLDFDFTEPLKLYSIATDDTNLYIYDSGNEYPSVKYVFGESDYIEDAVRANDTIIKYYFESGPALVFGDWVLSFANKTKYYKREIQGTNTPLERPTDKIPVLSKFAEPIITSFYLDGYYWFITQKHIFGTGAANGQLTIEFFDPMKYYAVTEKLTAAMRISDTSFWVFHNDGAYLIYKSTASNDDGSYYVWLCTNTAKSKGCDFLNAIVTLPVSSNVAVVTAEDICSVEMKENIQSDDRTLVPMTMNFREMVRDLLNHTSDIVIVNYRYSTIFFLNKETVDGILPAIVFDNSINSWWYWEFPVDRIYQANQTEINVELLIEYKSTRVLYKFSDELFTKRVGAIDYEIYADKLKTITTIHKYATVNLVPDSPDSNLSSITDFSKSPGIIYNNPQDSSITSVKLRNFADAFSGITAGTRRFHAIRTLTASGRQTTDFSFANIYLYNESSGSIGGSGTKYYLFKSDVFDKMEFDFDFEVKEEYLNYQMYMEMGRNLGQVQYTNVEVDWTETTEKPEEIVQIDWEWESAILLFGTTDFRKQLLFTTFTFDDYFDTDNHLTDKSYVNFEFYFKIYSRSYAATSPQVTSTSVERVTNNACRTMIGSFNYLQMVLRNRKFEDDDEGYSALVKPKICNISMKYRILRGTLT